MFAVSSIIEPQSAISLICSPKLKVLCDGILRLMFFVMVVSYPVHSLMGFSPFSRSTTLIPELSCTRQPRYGHATSLWRPSLAAERTACYKSKTRLSGRAWHTGALFERLDENRREIVETDTPSSLSVSVMMSYYEMA
jgi:hypothetical protein